MVLDRVVVNYHPELEGSYLLEPDVAHGFIRSPPHKRQVSLQLFVRVCEGIILREAVQGVRSRGIEGPGTTHQHWAQPC